MFLKTDSIDRPSEHPTSGSAAQILGDVLDHIAGGVLRSRRFAVHLWDGSELPPNAAHPDPLTIRVEDPSALAHLLRAPNTLGLARAWATGALDLEGDLDDAFRMAELMPTPRLTPIDHVRALHGAVKLNGRQALASPPAVDGELRRRGGALHSRARDRQAVRHHYDLPTDFHRLVIGPSMVYSCAYFTRPQETLEQAQERKLDVICRKLHLRPGDRFLDVGCGWGSLVLHAARYYGVNAVGFTLSEPQADEARQRLRSAGPDVDRRCQIRVADYREIDDQPFDAIASVGMYEHVGLSQLDTYTATIRRLLKPGGLFLNHGIARLTPGQLSPFIDRFIFPDGELHPVGELIRALERQRWELRDIEALREHYALTLRHWIANLHTNREHAIAIAGTQLERIWRLYLTGSARAFERGSLSLFQTLSVRPGFAHRIPLARPHLISEPPPTADSTPTPNGTRREIGQAGAR